MSRKKRTLKEIESESEEEYEPSRKRSCRIADKQKQKEEESKNMFDLEVFEYDTIAIVSAEPSKIKGSSKIAAFDMDWTLIRPKGKNKFPKGRKDWIFMYDKTTIPNKLKQMHKNGYQIIIFTNQNGIGSGKQSLDSVSGKIIDISQQLEIPIYAFLTIQKDYWRKPNVSMWHYFEKYYNNNIKIDYNSSFYCGDAAGRPKAWKNKDTKKDFSCSDRKFAHNIGISFHTPEAYFLREKENNTWKWLSLNPRKFLEKKENNCDQLKDVSNFFHGKLPIAKNDKEILDLVLMRGPPGCGKSTFAKKYLVCAGYEWINRDTLKTKKKCIDAAKKALKNGKNVVIDNTNPDYNAREPYIKVGKQFKANIRLFNMTTDRQVAEHMNLVRERITKGQTKRIPGLVYNIFYKKVREDDPPSVEDDEGLNEIIDIDFIPQFKDDQEKKLW
eukprot:732738_1